MVERATLPEPWNTICALVIFTLLATWTILVIRYNLNRRKQEHPMKPGDLFRHFKSGHIYRIDSLFTWEPTLEKAVLYINEETGEKWARPLSVFLEEVPSPDDATILVRRFTPTDV